jgi:hypothetical protein
MIPGVLIRKEGGVYKEKGHVKMEVEYEWCYYKPKNAMDCLETQKARKKQERVYP